MNGLHDDSKRIARALRGSHRQAGMTLVEIMIVLTIMAGIMAFAAYSVVGYLKNSKIKTAQAEVEQIRGFVENFRILHDGLPDDLDQLTQEVDGMGKITERIGEDPWGNEYQYDTGSGALGFVISSMGPDGQNGSDDDIIPEDMVGD